jgi:enoyl-CoA hydratase
VSEEQHDPGRPTLTVRDGRACVRLHRPDKRNRIEPADLEALLDFSAAIAADESVRCVVIESEGPSWCSGYHLGALATGGPPNPDAPRRGFGEACDALAGLAVPTIAVLGGSVHGGGTDLAMSCDFRVAADHIVLAMPAAKIGLQYYATGLQRFVERIGPTATKRIFLTAETISADELLRLGYLTDLVPAERLELRVDELCHAIGQLAPGAVRATKAAIDELAGLEPDLGKVQAGHLASLRSHDHREAMKALTEKRPPKFTGT